MPCMPGSGHALLGSCYQYQIHAQRSRFTRHSSRRAYAVGPRRILRCAAAEPSKKEGAPPHKEAQSFTSRLQSNPVYQRFKARKSSQPQEQAVTPVDAGNKSAISSTPEPQQNSPQLTQDTLKVAQPSAPSQSTASGTSQTPAAQQSRSPGRNQSITFRPQSSIAKPRPFLQPLSAQQQSSYSLTQSQPSVPRHVDFAEGIQQPKAAVPVNRADGAQQLKAPASINFWLTFHAEFGQRLRIVGSHKNLGSWVLVDGPELSWTEGDRWHAKIELPSGTIYEYKYVLLDSSGTNALTWQRGNNSVLAIKQDESELEVFDNWEGQPGAAVMSGGKSSTRESKLLAWATDIEAQLGIQRQDLRRSRMELASAQEDARKARQEARAMRMELAQSQSVRAQADRLIRQLQSSNRLLKSELQATTTSFKQALHAAASRLQTVEEEEGRSAEDSSGEAGDSMQEDLQPSQATAELPPQPSQATTVPPHKSQDPSVEPPSGSSEAAVQPPPMSTQAAVSGGGLQGSALESATSSNARHHSTATKASGGPDSPAQVSGSSTAVPGADQSQPQLSKLPKHSKNPVNGTHASPLKASAGFPESAPSDTRETLDPTAAAGKQLEQSRTGIPSHPKQSNATASAAPRPAEATPKSIPAKPEQSDSAALAALKPAAAIAGANQVVGEQPAVKELQQTMNSVQPSLDQSNAAAEQKLGKATPFEATPKGKQSTDEIPAGEKMLQVPSKPAGAALPTSGQPQVPAVNKAAKSDQSAGKELTETVTTNPSGKGDSNAAAETQPQKEPNPASTSGKKQQPASDLSAVSNQPAGKQLQQTLSAVPAQTEKPNAAAEKQSGKAPRLASNPSQQANVGNSAGSENSAGKQLQQTMNAVPSDIDKSNAAAQKAPIK